MIGALSDPSFIGHIMDGQTKQSALLALRWKEFDFRSAESTQCSALLPSQDHHTQTRLPGQRRVGQYEVQGWFKETRIRRHIFHVYLPSFRQYNPKFQIGIVLVKKTRTRALRLHHAHCNIRFANQYLVLLGNIFCIHTIGNKKLSALFFRNKSCTWRNNCIEFFRFET